jgi:DNA-binding NarL/FixJ family response regulator
MRLLIVDDHRAVTEAFAAYLSRDHEIAGVLDDHTAVLPLLANHRVDLVLLDGSLPRCDIFDLIRRITKRTKVIVMTMYPRSSRWPGLRRMGANGIVSKSVGLEEFAAEICRLAANDKPPDDGDRTAEVPEPTSRQLEVLIAMARGTRAKEISAAIGLGLDRTNEVIGEVLHLLKATDRAEVVLRAVELGWIEPQSPPPHPTPPLTICAHASSSGLRAFDTASRPHPAEPDRLRRRRAPEAACAPA